MVSKLRRWWKEGEGAGCIVFRSGLWGSFGILVIFPLFAWTVSRSVSLSNEIFIWSLYGILVIRILFKTRRAVIFSGRNLTYRPPYGRLRTISLDEVARVSPTTVFLESLPGGIAVKGLRLTLREGGSFVLPLDFKNSDKIIQLVEPSQN